MLWGAVRSALNQKMLRPEGSLSNTLIESLAESWLWVGILAVAALKARSHLKDPKLAAL